MNRKCILYWFCIALSVAFAACTNRPSGVISKQKMEDALYDVYLAQSLAQNSPRYQSEDSKDSLLAAVYTKNGISKAEFDSSIAWYATQSEVYFKINAHISQRLQDLQKKIGVDDGTHISQNMRKPFDGFNLPPSFTVGEKFGSPVFAFRIDSTKFGQIDTTAFDFNFKTLGVTSKTPIRAVVTFQYRDTTVYRKLLMTQNGHFSVVRPMEVRHHLTNISGYIRLSNPQGVFAPVFLYELAYKKIIPKPISVKRHGDSPPFSKGKQRSSLR